jgi:hypothetical protein
MLVVWAIEGGDTRTAKRAGSMAKRKPRKPVRKPTDQVAMGTEPRTPVAGTRTKRVAVVDEGSYRLSTLVQCLHRYVEVNPSRFTAREDGPDRFRIVTFVLAQFTDQP